MADRAAFWIGLRRCAGISQLRCMMEAAEQLLAA